MSADTIYFAQHGLALDKADDPERSLSDLGREQTEAIARQLHHAAIPISQILHSGKPRAAQTAEIIASIVDVASASAIAHLSPNDDVTLITQNLKVNNALYIGHLPHLEKLVTYLVTNTKSEHIIEFQNSSIVCLQRNTNGYHIKWHLTPDLLAR